MREKKELLQFGTDVKKHKKYKRYLYECYKLTSIYMYKSEFPANFLSIDEGD